MPNMQPTWLDVREDGCDRIRAAGVAGAGGAGFPSYAKWDDLEQIDSLLMNHQESEPNYFIDKWLGKTKAKTLAALFEVLLNQEVVDRIVVSAKWKDRKEYMHVLESETDGTIVPPRELPLERDEYEGVVFAYTDNKYQYGMENVLLRAVDGTVLSDDLPMDHGWLVQNTETLVNIARALSDGTPVTRKHVHVSGEVSRDRFLEVPLGTPASDLLRAADCLAGELPPDTVLADGGPGWCFPADEPADAYGVHKNTNCLLVLEEETVDENTRGSDRIDVREEYDWTRREMETEPSAKIEPEVVRIPLVTNPAPEVVYPSTPVVDVGDRVERGERIARASAAGISIPQHASITGTVTAVSETTVEIEAASPSTTEVSIEQSC